MARTSSDQKFNTTQNGGICTAVGQDYRCECVSVADTCYSGPTCAGVARCTVAAPPPPSGCESAQLSNAIQPCPELAVGEECHLLCEDGYHSGGVAMCQDNGDGVYVVWGGSCVSGELQYLKTKLFACVLECSLTLRGCICRCSNGHARRRSTAEHSDDCIDVCRDHRRCGRW